ncbi:hypothetical protein AAF712_005774 [Marasmius tenuissimus]|uniref:Uncharacterized protein n=1 Tax=Marasmius tenuissimus TaxID=585030 RepID=A0ABR3A1E8_9AGAR
MAQGIVPGQSDSNSTEFAHIPLKVRQNSLNWNGRKRRTHADPWRVKRFKEKELAEQLEINHDIRIENKRRRNEDELHIEDNERHEEPGSPQASEWSISEGSWEILKKSPDTFQLVKRWLTTQKRFEIEQALKADTAPAAAPASSSDTAKKKGTISTKAKKFVTKPRRLGIKTPPVFHRSILEWCNYHEKQTPPLAIFLTDNLKKLNNDSAREYKKVTHPEEGTALHVLDLSGFCKKHGIDEDDTHLSYTETMEALENWATCEEERDPDGAEGDYTYFALQHTGYVDAQPDKVGLHYLWKKEELKLRKRRFEEQVEYDAIYYESRWDYCRMKHDQNE